MAQSVLPLPEEARKEQTKRRRANKISSYHLTGDKTIKFIKEADHRVKEKEIKDKKTENIKKEAVKQAWTAERKAKLKMKPKYKKVLTCLTVVTCLTLIM